MNWIETVISTTSDGIEPVSGILLLNEISGYTVQDSRDFCDFLSDKQLYWDYIDDELLELKECDTTVTFYIENSGAGLQTIENIKNALARLKNDDTAHIFGSLDMSFKTVEDEDWATNWKKYFKPLEIGQNIIIKPTWEELPEKFSEKTVIEIDPSSSFGTGSHITTKLCLEFIEKCMQDMGKVENLIDVGCGSGILGIAACKLGAGHVTCIDIEENSVNIAKENFSVNNIPYSSYEVVLGNIVLDSVLFNKISSKKYDIIAANIVADVLKNMAPLFKNILSENGKLIISGIISERAKEVCERFQSYGFNVDSIKDESEWTAIILSVL